MFMLIFLLKVYLVRMTLGKTRRPALKEPLGPGFSSVWTYLDYEEPPFDFDKGLTADDFANDYAEFYTKQNRPISFGWEVTNEGEVPWAGVIVGHGRLEQGCGAILLTEHHLMTPCACVRTYLFKSEGKKDRDEVLKRKTMYYEADQGENIHVVFDAIEFHPDLLEANLYPKITGVEGAELCFSAWDIHQIPDANERYLGYYQPAILKFSPSVPSGVDVPWPPSPIVYNRGPFVEPVDSIYVFYSMKDESTLFGAHYISFNFKPFEKNLKTWDNFNREIKLDNRQIELYVKLCSQTNCGESKEFGILNALLGRPQLRNLLCWCDVPEPQEELMFQNWKDAAVPHFIRSVYGGLLGSPIIYKGGLVGWEMQIVEFGKRTPAGNRASLSRGIDATLIDYINSKIPELATGNRPVVHDRNRPQFAVHDQELFLPDPDLTEEDVDLLSWSLQGVSLRHELSGKEPISHGQTFILVFSFMQLFILL